MFLKRAIVNGAPNLFSAAYAGRTSDAVEALTTGAVAFPQAAIVWVDLRGSASRIPDGPPRGVVVGR